MSATFENFEKRFTATNLKNGLSYWKKDKFELVDDSPTVLEAIVYGENEYRTLLKCNGDTVIDVNCTCPNHRTLFCKHVAVLYYEKFKAIFNFKKSKTRASKKTALKTKALDSNENTLNNLSIEQLRTIVSFSMKFNKEIKDYVESIASHKSPSKLELYKLYSSSLKKLIKTNTKHHYITISATNKIGKQALNYLDQAELYFENKATENGIYICKAILEVLLNNIFLAAIDSVSDYTTAIDRAIDEVSSVIEETSTPSKLRKHIFTFLFNLLQKEYVLFSSYEVTLLKLTAKASSSISEKEKLVAFLEENIKRTYKVQEYYLVFNTLIEKYDGKEAAKTYLVNNSAIPLFREKIYQQLIENKKYQEAKTLIEEGVKVNEDDYNTLINWYKKLLFIAEETNDAEGVITNSAIVFLNINDPVKSLKYYTIHKEQFTDEDWKKQLPLLLSKIKNKNKLEEIYLIEGLMDEFLKSVSEDNNTYHWRIDLLPFKDKHLDKLLPQYEDQILKTFNTNINTFLEYNKGKSYYKEVCETIIKLKKRDVEVSEIIKGIKESYARRPSLMHFLNTYFLQ